MIPAEMPPAVAPEPAADHAIAGPAGIGKTMPHERIAGRMRANARRKGSTVDVSPSKIAVAARQGGAARTIPAGQPRVAARDGAVREGTVATA